MRRLNVMNLDRIRRLPVASWLGLMIFCLIQSLYPQSNYLGNVENGESIYFNYCSTCHGVKGDGNGPATTNMYPPPRDFTTGIFKYRSTSSGSLPTDNDLTQIIEMGVPQSWMPAWNDILSESQITDVIRYLKNFYSIQQEWIAGEPLPSLITIQPPRTEKLTKQGEGFYLILECWTCHDVNGGGKGPSAKTLMDHKARKIKAADLTRDDYRVGSSAFNIRKTFLTGLSGTPMPNYEGLFIIAKEELEETENEELGSKSQQILNNFVSELPTYEDLDRLTDKQLTALSENNEWALVHYVQSLVREKTLFDWLFRINPEDVPKKH